ncbi:endoribonuclease l-psp [Apiospora arundinis]|uniref:Endoribonuclease l-psp n=1 Tax=Apiospora arundinis TaxID=335852 RepID=A0ABR2HSH7_9PEZI
MTMKLTIAVTSLVASPAFTVGQATPNYTSPLGVEIFNPAQLFNASGIWSLMSRAGNTLYISGMRGFYPSNTTLAPVGRERIYQAFANMKTLAELGGSDLTSCVRLQVFVTDMYRWRPLVNEVQAELWRTVAPNYPPRTIVEVDRLNDDDIVEVEGTFYLGG